MVERRENEEEGGRTADESGREESEDVREFVRDDSISRIEGFLLDILLGVKGGKKILADSEENDRVIIVYNTSFCELRRPDGVA